MSRTVNLRDRFRGCLLGLATGDAVGTTLEFRPRGTFTLISEMTGGGPFNLAPGQWTNDTSMALCLAASLTEKRGFDPVDQMKRYLRWIDEGYMSSTGRCFDIGNTTARALVRFRNTGDPFSGPTDPFSSGNGSIMRLAPVPMFFYPDEEAAVRYAAESSRTTHGSQECVDACRLFAGIIVRALHGSGKDDVLFTGGDCFEGTAAIAAIARGGYRDKLKKGIRGSGYVVESLKAALWCFFHTDSFENAILRAANLGDDADTTAAVCGQVAGAYYGLSGIPDHWLERLAMREEICSLAEQLCKAEEGV